MKRVDKRVKTLIDNCVKKNERSIFVVLGKNGRDRIVNLFYLLKNSRETFFNSTKDEIQTKSPASIKKREHLTKLPRILWTYKKNLGFKSNESARRKEMMEKHHMSREQVLDNQFHIFLSVNSIRYTYFKDTEKILGQTFDMVIIQEYEGLTPNVLARVTETVRGGGIIVFLMNQLDNIKQFMNLSHDVHSRFQESAISKRFNERFILSLSECKNCLVIDHMFNIIPISKQNESIEPISIKELTSSNEIVSENEQKLNSLINKSKSIEFINKIVSLCATYDQAEAVLEFAKCLKDRETNKKDLNTTMAMTAGRGRGKSACLGLIISLAIMYGFANISVTSPSAENVKTLFEFVGIGLQGLGYVDKSDFETIQSTDPEDHRAIVKVIVKKESFRQTIQYIKPSESIKVQQSELLVIDEAAAIPLPVIRNLLGNYMVFLSSTTNGYEGTGRLLSLNLLKDLKAKRNCKEISLDEPIRYAMGDNIEAWLNLVLCLNPTSSIPKANVCPYPKDCQLYYVSRETLFSFHKETEIFLHNMMSLFVSANYQNSPDDLQMIADAPNQHLFVLLPDLNQVSTNGLPPIFCAIQIACEGLINKSAKREILNETGDVIDGDLIPWTLGKYFQESELNNFSCARIVRIATHPDFQKYGYGSRAIELLKEYYQGHIINIDEEEEGEGEMEDEDAEDIEDEKMPDLINKDNMIVKKDQKDLPPLLTALEDRENEKIDYIGVSFGVNNDLFRFWRKFSFDPVFIDVKKNEISGEHSCIMLLDLFPTTVNGKEVSLFDSFSKDFIKRFFVLLAYHFKSFPSQLALNIIGFDREKKEHSATITKDIQNIIKREFTQFDIKRLKQFLEKDSYLDYNIILDLVPIISKLLFSKIIPKACVVGLESLIFVGIGLQKKSIKTLSQELNLKPGQLINDFRNALKRIYTFIDRIFRIALENEKKKEEKSLGKRKIEEISGKLDFPSSKIQKTV